MNCWSIGAIRLTRNSSPSRSCNLTRAGWWKREPLPPEESLQVVNARVLFVVAGRSSAFFSLKKAAPKAAIAT